MKFKIKDEDLVVRDLQEVVNRIPIEWRLKGVDPIDRLKGLSPEDRLAGLNPKDILKGLNQENLRMLKQELDKLNLN